MFSDGLKLYIDANLLLILIISTGLLWFVSDMDPAETLQGQIQVLRDAYGRQE